MKVNTDGVLLGAWQPIDKARLILDVGSGSGVIAMMMAQKNEYAVIDAIDIDDGAFEQAKENFRNSPWGNRLNAIHGAVQNYFPYKTYDLIISNPPYFIDDHKTGDHKKDIARHSTALSYEELIINIARLLTVDGRALIAIPNFNFPEFESLALKQKLFVVNMAEVIATTNKPAYIMLIQLEKTMRPVIKSTIQIQNNTAEFTEQYRALTKDFYLKF